jgi:hypothetical protein
MSRTVTSRSVDRLLDVMNDTRFRPHLFAISMIDESPYVNSIFFEIIQSYIREMARDYQSGVSNHNGIAYQCNQYVGGSSINLT